MAKTAKALVEIRGTRPLFWDRFGPERIPLTRKKRQASPVTILKNGAPVFLRPPGASFTCRRTTSSLAYAKALNTRRRAAQRSCRRFRRPCASLTIRY